MKTIINLNTRPLKLILKKIKKNLTFMEWLSAMKQLVIAIKYVDHTYVLEKVIVLIILQVYFQCDNKKDLETTVASDKDKFERNGKKRKKKLKEKKREKKYGKEIEKH